MKRGAIFSKDRYDRYLLWRIWDEAVHKRLVVIGLNPSTADEHWDDATIRRCIGFAKRENCGGLYMLNLFSYRSTDPRGLADPWAHRPRRQKINAEHIILNTSGVNRFVVVAWGNHPRAVEQGQAVIHAIAGHKTIWCFGRTKSGAPLHPLRLAKTTPFMPYA